MKRPSREVAREILKIIPLVMRTVAAELRAPLKVKGFEEPVELYAVPA